ncbi:hypothetical protein Syun_030395 [Stephania yunnanensis]|uniref:Small ribosomal subunit protein uS7 domain-containing protein n=1 Tax=Stephania yunnanensis TaxID=152371 RepID=A0AAP0E7H7_9MAGN
MAVAQEVKLFNRWSFDEVEVRLNALRLLLPESVIRMLVFGFDFGCSAVVVLLNWGFRFWFMISCVFLSDIGGLVLFRDSGNWVLVSDISLADYIAANPSKHATYVPHTAGRYSVKRFRKAQCPIIERLTNSMMMHGRNNGKKLKAVRIVKHAMEIIHLLTDQNPIQVIVDAVINSGPREDATRIGSAGVVRRQAVDISPLRRVNQALYLLTTGARESAFRNIKTVAECLADELINAAKGSSNSYAIKKKDEVERVAKANR